MRRGAWVVGLLLGASLAPAQLLPRERKGIEDALAIAGLREDDLNALRPAPDPASNADAPALSRRFAREPLAALEAAMDLAPPDAAASGEDDLLESVRRRVFGEPAFTPPKIESVPLPETVPAALRLPVARLVGAIGVANAEIRGALAKLTPEERRTLIEGLPIWAGRRAGLRADFAKEGATLEERPLFALLARVDLPRLRRAGVALARETDTAIPALKAAASSVGAIPPIRLTVAGVIVEIAGAGPDDHPSRDAALSIDLGGANRYRGRAGAGIGYAAVMIDLGSVDFDAPDAAAGCGLLGVGVARVEGDATGRSGLLAFGAGVAGVGSLSVGGRATLESRALAQGFGLAGIGLLRTGPGRDELRLGADGQGCGFAGGAGLLVDLGGDDRRLCPGIAPDDAPNERESCAQGYGEAGVGLLIDRGGDDVDEIGARGQGAGDAGGFGMLDDLAGDDLRRASRFAQGYGANGGAGALLDLAGDDLDAALGGEAHGCGDDGGLGVFLDRAGNDAVVGGAAGVGAGGPKGGSVGLFLSGGGRDEIAARTRPVASDGSLSLFIHLGEDARGFDLPPPGAARPSPGWGADLAFPSIPTDAVPDGPAPGSLSPDPARIARAVGLLAARRGALRAGAVRELVAYGRPGLEAALARLEALDPDRDPGALEAVAEIVRRLRDPGARTLAPSLAKPTRNALAVAALARVLVPAEALTAALTDDAPESALRRLAALDAVAATGDPSLAGAVLPLLLSDNRETARRAARALLRVGGETEAASVRSLVATADPALRRLVLAFLARFPSSQEWAKGLLTDADSARVAAGIELLGEIGTDEALRMAGTGLNAPDSASGRPVRLAALRALSGRVPEPWRARVLELQNDADPLVAAAARGVELGR